MSRLQKLITDAIDALDLAPSAKTPATKFDIMRIGTLIGHEVSDDEANDCLMFLLSHKALGARFTSELLTSWWGSKLGYGVEDALAPFQTTIDSFPSYPQTPKPPQNHRKSDAPELVPESTRLRRQKGPKPVKLACSTLLEYLEANKEKGGDIVHDSQFKHLVNECLMIINENPTSKAAFQRAVDSFQDTQRRYQAKVGQEFAHVSRRRLEQTNTVRNEKLTRDVEFLMRNQTSANKGSAVYFLLTPSWKPRRRSPATLLKSPEENKRLQRILNNSAI